MKKVFAVLVALTLVLSCAVMAFAAETPAVATGTIKIDNALEGAVYNIYKMFDFEPVEGSTNQGRYSYANDLWNTFVETGDGSAYLTFDADAGTIVWKGATDENGNADATEVAELAKKAVAYAKANSIPAAKPEQTAPSDGEIVFTDVELGYYAIDTSLGTICALTNVNEVFEAHEKNAKPDIDKWVQEDKDNSWGKVNDADIGQVVNYKSTITVGVGATNYVMHDTMDAGLTFDESSVKVEVNGAVVSDDNYDVIYPATDDTNGVNHTFDVTFEDDYILSLAQGTEIVVYYEATLNENANIVTPGNNNKVYLSYGETSTWNTATHETSTYTWKMDISKIDAADGKALEGAKFQLSNNNGTIKFTAVEGATVPTYKVDADGAVTEITTDESGKFEIIGLDEGVYTLKETAAPAGYNMLTEDVTITITSEYDEENLTATYKINNNAPATIEVENSTGSLLPETGGIGTTIFYVVGGLLMVCALVVLVSKKRMASFA